MSKSKEKEKEALGFHKDLEAWQIQQENRLAALEKGMASLRELLKTIADKAVEVAEDVKPLREILKRLDWHEEVFKEMYEISRKTNDEFLKDKEISERLEGFKIFNGLRNSNNQN